ncbi:DUF1189 domain-containing protein [Heyndrickxia sp. NPDC080065]|uniref:DUF1189 domain-containing protein n=1 Tax=Heyndrickxia sp. NPDC080065 TaxID=3390568 RepID=UPI003D058D05
MNDLNIFQRFIKSLYSPKDIAKFRFLGIGKTILYVFILMFLSTLPGLYHFSTMSITALNEGKQIFMEELPPFQIENGVLTSDQKEPLTVQKTDFNIVLDPTGQLSVNDIKDQGNAVALLKNEFVIVTNRNAQNFPYSTLGDIKLTNRDIDSFLSSLHGALWIILPILFIFYYLFVSALGFIKISIFAGIGVLFAQTLSRKLHYRQSWRLAAHCITLPTVFFILMDILKTGVPGGLLIDWLISLIFLYLSIREIPKPQPRN